MKTKILSLILSLVMVITMVPKLELNVSADNSTITDEQGIDYKLNDDGTATVLGPKEGVKIGTKFVIPAEINGYRVTIIADDAFNVRRMSDEFCDSYNSYDIDDYTYLKRWGKLIVEFSSLNNIEIIGKRAFNKCFIPAGEIILDHLKEIGDGAFENCSFAEGAERHFEIESGGDSTNYMREFVIIDISKSLTTLGQKVFFNTFGLKEVKLPKDFSNHLNFAFAKCYDLENLDVPAGVTKFNNWEFAYCKNLRLDKLPPNLTEIGDSAFYECKNLRFKKLPDGLRKIGIDAFNGAKMEELTIPYGWTEIPEAMLYGAEINLVNMPITIESIGKNAFAYSELTSINVEADSGIVNIPSGVKYIGEGAFKLCKRIRSVNIPASVSYIEKLAFFGNDNLTAINGMIDSGVVNIPSGVESIGESAFGSCRGIKLLNISNSVSKIERRAFANCINLTAINGLIDSGIANIPSGVESIGESAFENCIGIKLLNISNSVSKIGRRAFANCINLTAINDLIDS